MRAVPTFEEYETKSVNTLPGTKVVIGPDDELRGWYNISYSETTLPSEEEQLLLPTGEYEVLCLDSDTIVLFPESNDESCYTIKRGDFEKLKMKIQL